MREWRSGFALAGVAFPRVELIADQQHDGRFDSGRDVCSANERSNQCIARRIRGSVRPRQSPAIRDGIVDLNQRCAQIVDALESSGGGIQRGCVGAHFNPLDGAIQTRRKPPLEPQRRIWCGRSTQQVTSAAVGVANWLWKRGCAVHRVGNQQLLTRSAVDGRRRRPRQQWRAGTCDGESQQCQRRVGALCAQRSTRGGGVSLCVIPRQLRLTATRRGHRHRQLDSAARRRALGAGHGRTGALEHRAIGVADVQIRNGKIARHKLKQDRASATVPLFAMNRAIHAWWRRYGTHNQHRRRRQ